MTLYASQSPLYLFASDDIAPEHTSRHAQRDPEASEPNRLGGVEAYEDALVLENWLQPVERFAPATLHEAASALMNI